jgi:galactose mutarotase-like enzyme
MEEATKMESGEDGILLRAGNCSVTILPHFGGKIASIRLNDHELLQTPLAAYAPRTHTMAFDAGDASGWDECLPSVAECMVETAAGSAAIPDHGDLWRVAWQPVVASCQSSVDSGQLTAAAKPNSAAFRGECFSLPLVLKRTVTLIETGKDWRLSLGYTVTNRGGYPVPWSWAVHPLFTAEPGDKIVLPESIRELRLEGSGGGRLGQADERVAWPVAMLAQGGQTDLSVTEPPESGIGDKLFAGPLSATENWCALERPQAGVRIKVSFDPVATPYLGLWICYGGWPSRPGPKQTCVALEPTTAPVDSLAKTGPWSRVLSPSESYFWPMTVDLQPIESVTCHA